MIKLAPIGNMGQAVKAYSTYSSTTPKDKMNNKSAVKIDISPEAKAMHAAKYPHINTGGDELMGAKFPSLRAGGK